MEITRKTCLETSTTAFSNSSQLKCFKISRQYLSELLLEPRQETLLIGAEIPDFGQFADLIGPKIDQKHLNPS